LYPNDTLSNSTSVIGSDEAGLKLKSSRLLQFDLDLRNNLILTSKVFDFEEAKPTVRDVIPGMKYSARSVPIERGHRLLAINGADAQSLTLDDLVTCLGRVRPLTLTFEKRPLGRAAGDVG
jgi:hypothetical protein